MTNERSRPNSTDSGHAGGPGIDRRNILMAGGSVLAAALAPASTPAEAQQPASGRKPNIVFMLVDNLGWGDLSCYVGPTRGVTTPRLDKFASEGLRLTNFMVETACTPSRSALMTGRMPIRSGTSAVENSG